MHNADTLPKYFLRNYKIYGEKKIAMRAKSRGVWKSCTWSDYYDHVKYISLYLISMGLQRGDKVSILGENKPEVYWAEMAALAAGSVAVGIFSDCTAEEVKYFINHSDTVFIFAHDQEQVDKVLQIKDQIPKVKKAIYWDSKGLWSYDDPILAPMEEVLEKGRDFEKKNPKLFESRLAKGRGSDIAVLVYTSGTTGRPKAAMLNHTSMIKSALSFMKVDCFGDADNYLSFVPLAWVTEQIIGIASSTISGFVVNFPEKADTVTENIREIGPGIIFFSPRQWESINRTVQSKILDTSWLKRKIYDLFLPAGLNMADQILAKQTPGFLLRVWGGLAYWFLFRRLKDNLGLLRLRVGYTAGSGVSPNIIRFFQGIGVNIKQIYGSSEMGLVTAHRDGDIRPETSGMPLPGAEVRLSKDGEILVKNAGMFVGYHKDKEGYENKFSDGWYRSGDYGYLNENNHLIVIDRMEDLRFLRGNRKFSPQYPEIRLRFSPYIKEVLVVGGEERDYASCLVNIDLDNVGRWAEARKISYTTFADLTQKEEIINLIKKEIQSINKNLPEEARLKKFLNMPKEFDADESELTRTRKLRRTFLEDRYQDLIDGIYGGKNVIEVETPVVYRDGRQGILKRTIKISKLN